MLMALNCDTPSHPCQYVRALEQQNTKTYSFRMSTISKILEAEMKLRGWNDYKLAAVCCHHRIKISQHTNRTSPPKRAFCAHNKKDAVAY